MNTPLSLHEVWFTITELLGWRDIIEILACSSVIYYFSLWLKKDRQKNLLGYFYAYCTAAFTAYAADLSTITYLMSLCSPAVVLIFILIHQRTLQKNFVALRTITPASQETHDWLDALIRSCLIALNNNKKITCIIEHRDSLNEHIHADISLNAPLKDDLLALIIESHVFNDNQLLWVNSQGILLGFNAHVTHMFNETLALEKQPLELWKQQALSASSNTDALIVHITPAKRLFDVMSGGKLVENLSASATLLLIEKSLKMPYKKSSQGENSHVLNYEKHSAPQRGA